MSDIAEQLAAALRTVLPMAATEAAHLEDLCAEDLSYQVQFDRATASVRQAAATLQRYDANSCS